MSILDFLFPKRCVCCKKFGSYLCPNCFSSLAFIDTMVCTHCQRQAIGGLTHPVCKTRYSIDGVFPSLVYKGVVKKLVYVFKYPPYLTDLQSQLVDLLYEGIIQKEQFTRLLDESVFFVPIPLHETKFRKRGYNQSQLLAEGLAKRFDSPVVDCLKREKHTKTQVGLSKEDRKENIANAFSLKTEISNLAKNYQHILLVDDVVTSGATLREAAKVLKKAGFKNVWGVTLAHGE
jgi:competence protein ComFC